MLEESCCFDTLYRDVLLPEFEQIEDARRSNASYSQLEALKSGFALYSLKSPSLYLSVPDPCVLPQKGCSVVYGPYKDNINRAPE